MKTGQAALAIRMKCHNSIEAQIGQYMWIPSLFQSYSDLDPDGTYILEHNSCNWTASVHQFKQ